MCIVRGVDADGRRTRRGRRLRLAFAPERCSNDRVGRLLVSIRCISPILPSLLYAGVLGMRLLFRFALRLPPCAIETDAANAVFAPCIAVLSTLEGVAVTSTETSTLVVPVTLGLITLLAAIQRFGTVTPCCPLALTITRRADWVPPWALSWFCGFSPSPPLERIA